MWASIDALNQGVRLLRHYLDGLAKQDTLLAFQPDTCGAAGHQIKEIQEHFRSQNNKARYEYNTVIVSLYGYFERFIEELVSEYLRVVSDHIPKFAELPTAVQANHLTLSLELIRKADYQKFAGVVNVKDVVAKLHRCLNTPDDYELNVLAFSLHNANFRAAVVASTLNQCGLTDIGATVRNSNPFKSFIANEDPERNVGTYSAGGDDVVFARLDDLANRRNDVAHGVLVDDTLSHDLLRGLLDFIEAYTNGLAEVACERALPFLINKALRLGKPVLVIDNRIVCIDLPVGRVTVGDLLIAKTRDESRPFRGGPIFEIQCDHVAQQSVDGGPGVQIGMQVGFGAKDHYEFYLLKTPK